MELLNIEFLGRPLRLEGNMAGWQQLYWGNQLVSQRAASADAQGPIEHRFELQSGETVLQCAVALELQWQPFVLNYQTNVNGQLVGQGSTTAEDLERCAPMTIVPARKPFSIVGLGALALKLFKSAKVIKVVLAGASVAAYSWLFSLQFALALIACLVFHEYGHVRAMKHFGMKTKGIYLVPFMGGLALGEDRVNTRWQDVVISIMGPTFGLFMSLLCLIAYWLTGELFFAGLSAFNALLNLFNLLPIMPLDGGHILKSICFSMHSTVGLMICFMGIAAGVFLSYQFGLALLGLLLLVGGVEVFFEWKTRHDSRLLPLDRYGQVFSAVWYLLTLAGLVGIIGYFAGTGDALLGLPLKVLQS